MFLKSLIIQSGNIIIRNITFNMGINLIVDETRVGTNESQQITGNNVGKTTVLRLVDFCFGADGKSIYQDAEFRIQSNTKIEDFLKDNKVIIILTLVDNLLGTANETITIRKNFLSRSDKIQEIDGENIINNDNFDKRLKELILKTEVHKPTFKQIISKNIRDERNKMVNIVKVLNPYTKAEEYEALYLFWLGINTVSHNDKELLSKDKTKEENFQKRLKKDGDLSLIEQQLAVINEKINKLNTKKDLFNINENHNVEIEQLNEIKLKLNKLSTELGKLGIRKSLIIESKEELEQEYSSINTSQIQLLYQKAQSLIPNIQISFEETVKFHNDLITEKLEYITKELPELDSKIQSIKSEIEDYQITERKLTKSINQSTEIESFKNTIIDLNKLYERKGNLEGHKKLWIDSKHKLDRIERELDEINKGIYSEDNQIQSRIKEFNKYFTQVSLKLYGEEYLLSSQRNDKGYDLIVTNLEGNPSTGKKKGQIAAFDFAYIEFADKMDINCLHFIMHDQLETIHNNQLNTIVEVANNINGQYIVPILRDKIPSNIDVSQYEVLTLSQDDKLFRVS